MASLPITDGEFLPCKNIAPIIVGCGQPTCVVWVARKLLYTSLARLVTPWPPAGNVYIQSFYAPWKTDRRVNKNRQPHMKRSCLNERGRQVGRSHKNGGDPCGECTVFVASLGPACLPPRLHATRLHATRLHVTALCFCLTYGWGGFTFSSHYAIIISWVVPL